MWSPESQPGFVRECGEPSEPDGRGPGSRNRQRHLEYGPSRLRAEIDIAAVEIHDAAGDVEAESRALTHRLCREKRVEHARPDGVRDARPIVSDAH